MKRSIKYSIVLGSFLVIAGIGTAAWYWGFGIDEYRGHYDRASIMKIFDEDWPWLVAEGSDYSPEHTLDHKVREEYDFDTGKRYNIDLDVYVYRHMFKAIGFTAFGVRHPNTPQQHGFVLFLAVDRTHRGHGYARALLRYACEELFKRGCPDVELVTKATNYPAQKVYIGAGFKEQKREEGFIYYCLTRPAPSK